MNNPWLDIPLADYEGHMALPHVAQACLLSDVFADALKNHSPESIAILGCAGGNGFDRISPEVTKRVIGVDINPEYVREARRRFGDRMPALELIVGDIETDMFDFLPVDMVFAGLFFEYVDVDVVLARIRTMLSESGRLISVVQLLNPGIPEVTPTPFTSLRTLAMKLVSPADLQRLASVHGYIQTDSYVVESNGGKEFQVQTFSLMTPNTDIQPALPAGRRA